MPHVEKQRGGRHLKRIIEFDDDHSKGRKMLFVSANPFDTSAMSADKYGHE